MGENEIRKKGNNVKIIGFLILMVLIFSIWVIIKLIPREKDSLQISFEENVKKIFGVPTNQDDSGVTEVYYEEIDSAIHYHLYPSGLTSFKKEVGIKLASDIKKLYKKDNRAGNITFLILAPFQNKYGNTSWRPVLSFEFTRDLYTKINWDNFLKQDLLNVVRNLEWFRKI